MDRFRRTVGSLFVSSGYPRSLLLATYDDVSPADEAEVEIVVQGLLGSDSKVSSPEAKELLLRRLRENWTWKVVLKVLLVLHRLLNRGTKQWLKSLLGQIDTFVLCQSFREGEGSDPQAESHSHVIRKYAQYLQFLSTELIRTQPRYEKNVKLDSKMFQDKDEDELFSLVHFHSQLLKKCLHPFMTGSTVAKLNGSCPLSASCAFALLSDALDICKLASIAAQDLSDRYPRLHPNDVEAGEEAFDAFKRSADQVQLFSIFVRSFPELDQQMLPIFRTAVSIPELHGSRRKSSTRNRFAIQSSSSDDSAKGISRKTSRHSQKDKRQPEGSSGRERVATASSRSFEADSQEQNAGRGNSTQPVSSSINGKKKSQSRPFNLLDLSVSEEQDEAVDLIGTEKNGAIGDCFSYFASNSNIDVLTSKGNSEVIGSSSSSVPPPPPSPSGPLIPHPFPSLPAYPHPSYLKVSSNADKVPSPKSVAALQNATARVPEAPPPSVPPASSNETPPAKAATLVAPENSENEYLIFEPEKPASPDALKVSNEAPLIFYETE